MMFVEDSKRIEGKFRYLSWWSVIPMDCRVTIISRRDQIKVIVFQEHRSKGTSPMNCYEDIATAIRLQLLPREKSGSIHWYVYLRELRKRFCIGQSCSEWKEVGGDLWQITMKWEHGRFTSGEFVGIEPDKVPEILEAAAPIAGIM